MVHKLSKSLISVLSLGASSMVLADERPDPKQVHVNGIVYGGSGCPGGSAAVYLSEDALAFTLAFDDFAVEAGYDVPRSESRKFCNVNLNIHVPHGFQYTIFKVDYAGFADLERGTSGQIKSVYRFSGAAGRETATLSTILRGELVDDYYIHDNIGLASLVWSPCGVNRALNIKTEARVAARSGKGALLTVDTVDGEFEQLYSLQWRRCLKNSFEDNDLFDDLFDDLY